MDDGFELQMTDNRGEGVFATRSFQLGETVLVGRIDRELDHNHPHDPFLQVRFFLHYRLQKRQVPGSENLLMGMGWWLKRFVCKSLRLSQRI